MGGKQNRSALVFNVFGGINSCSEAFLGRNFFNCFNSSLTMTFLNENFMVLLIDPFVLRTLKCESKYGIMFERGSSLRSFQRVINISQEIPRVSVLFVKQSFIISSTLP